MLNDFQNVTRRYATLKSNWEINTPLWKDISKFVGINVDIDYIYNKTISNQSRQLDEYVDDPTASLSVNQAGDYLLGIMWGTGEKVFDIVPSRYVLEYANQQDVEPYYSFSTDQTLYHMNHPAAGYGSCLRPYAYDQFAFGTSGIGTFLNKSFLSRAEDNALLFRNYGVDNSIIDEGKSGSVDVGFFPHRWKVNRIISEFCMYDGYLDEEAYARLPKVIQKAWKGQNYNEEFTIVFGMFPREDYHPRLQGKRGTKYRGVWFLDGANDGKFFFEEDFGERPVNIARQIRIRGTPYGRASGSMMLSSIRSVNFMFATTIEILEKMGNPALGITSNAIFGDSVLDTSPNGLTVFNSMLANGNAPMFPIHDVGDPTGIIQFLIPYLNEKIATAFKIDALLDFSSAKDMTATESLQRYAIRGKSLSGMLGMQKNERLIPDVQRSISILDSIGELGLDPSLDENRAKILRDMGKRNRIIPDAVMRVKKEGRPWYELKFNNELEKLTRTEAVQALIQLINAITAIVSLYPDIVQAVDWYKLLRDINDNLDYNNQILITADQFKKIIAEGAKQKQVAMMLQAGQAGAQIDRDTASANKANAEAQAR